MGNTIFYIVYKHAREQKYNCNASRVNKKNQIATTKARSFEIPNIMSANFFIQSYTLVSNFPKIDKGISIESIGYSHGFKYVLIGLESTEIDE
jgi:hypothetical protein